MSYTTTPRKMTLAELIRYCDKNGCTPACPLYDSSNYNHKCGLLNAILPDEVLDKEIEVPKGSSTYTCPECGHDELRLLESVWDTEKFRIIHKMQCKKCNHIFNHIYI